MRFRRAMPPSDEQPAGEPAQAPPREPAWGLARGPARAGHRGFRGLLARTREWPIRRHLAVLALATVLPTVAAMVAGLVDEVDDETQHAQRQALQTAANATLNIDQFFSDAQHYLAALAMRPAMQALDAQRCDSAFAPETRWLMAEIDHLALHDTHGGLLCEVLAPETLPVMPARQAALSFVNATIQARDFTVAAQTAEDGKAHHLVASLPVMRRDVVAGVLSARVDLARLAQRVLHGIPDDVLISIFDGEGRTLLRSHDDGRWAGRPPPPIGQLQAALNTATRNLQLRDAEGAEWLHSVAGVQGTDWVVVASMTTDDIVGEFRQRLLAGGLIALASVLIALGLGRAMGRWITVSVVRLERLARRVAAGERGARAAVEGPREVAELARQFNRMLDEEQQVRARAAESERQLRETFDNVELIAVMVDAAGRVTYANDYLLKLAGWTRAELLGRSWFDACLPDGGAQARAHFERMMAGGAVQKNLQNELVTRHGERRTIHWNNTVLRSFDGVITGLSSIGEDITQRISSARRVDRLTNFYAALSRTNAAIVRMSAPAALYQELCNICVDFGHAHVAFIALVEGPALLPVAWAGPAQDFVDNLAIPLAPGPTAGPAALAVLHGRPYVTNRFMDDPVTLAWRERAAPLGTRSAAAFPFRRGGRVIGVLSLHVTEEDFFDAQLESLFEEMMRDLTFGLDSFDREAARGKSEAAAREGALRLELAAQAGNVGLWDLDLRTGRIFFSEEWLRQLGLAAGELGENVQAWKERVHPDDLEATWRALQGLIDDPREGFRFEVRLRHQNGSYRWVLAQASILRDDQGRRWRLLGSQIDITERKAAEARIEHLATHDSLTELPNRALVRDRLSQELHRARRAGRLVAVVCMDLDRFKLINDGYGHRYGDALLQAVAARLSATVREGDTVARLGGDEFLLVLPDLGKQSDAYRIIQKLLDALARPLAVLDREMAARASLGASLFPLNGLDAETLIANADMAMYRAKAQGGGAYQFFSSEMSDDDRSKAEFEDQLRRAIAQQQLHLHYQPKVDLQSGAIVGVEALTRWNHPGTGPVSPARFIRAAEESGLIVPLGDWVLRTACAQNRAWRDAGLPPIVVSVNLSVRQFMAQNVVATVLDTLAQTGLPPEALELELTESLLAQDTQQVIGTIDRLKEAGVKFSIDDFGTGYSSLSYLKRFKVDTLKIDQSFVRDLLSDPGDAAITRAIISLAHSLNLGCIAEGVETEAQCDFLRAHGCSQIQGYLFSKPVAPDAITAMLREGRRLECSP